MLTLVHCTGGSSMLFLGGGEGVRGAIFFFSSLCGATDMMT